MDSPQQRDMDLIRDLLMSIEGGTRSFSLTTPEVAEALGISTDGTVSRQQSQKLEYHLKLLEDARFVAFAAKLAGAEWMVDHITWAGHDFLDSIRDPEIWKATKEGARQAGGFSLDLLKALAKGLVKKQIEHHTGVTLDL